MIAYDDKLYGSVSPFEIDTKNCEVRLNGIDLRIW